MKKIFYLLIATAMFAGCEYLDKEPDDMKTDKMVWSNRAEVVKYLTNCYASLPMDRLHQDDPWLGCADECDIPWSVYPTYNINLGVWEPSTSFYVKWNTFYRTIRATFVFENNVGKCGNLSQDLKDRYLGEALFLRGYYYFLLLRQYGPVVLIKQQMSNDTDFGNMPRSPFDECAAYVCELMDRAERLLPDSYASEADNLGRATAAAALSVKAMMLMLQASPQWNGNPDYADFFFNCASSMTGEGIQMGIDAGGYVECENRALPAFLSSYKSKFELAFIHQSAPGIMVNIKGDNIGNIVSDNHYTMAKAKLNKDNGDTFYYVFDESSAVKLRDSESYGFNGYVAMFEKGEAVHYDSVEKASEELNLPNLADAIEANNAAALAGEPDEFGRRNCPYIETRDGLWAIRVDPTFYLTTAGLAIDTDCHVLNEEKKAIPGLYAAGDVCGSIEEKDAKQYGMGFDAALTYGYIMGETLKKEI